MNFSFLILPLHCSAQSIESRELISRANQYDAKTVVFAGEAIGDVMVPAEYGWINVNDGDNAIGVWIAAGLAREINYTGSYKSKGDWIEITGIFHRACPQHGGDLDIHAVSLRKVNNGRALVEKINPAKKSLLLTLSGVLCLVLILRQLKRKLKK